MLAATNEQILILTAVHSIPAISQLVASLYTLKFGHTAAELQWRSYVYEPALNGCYTLEVAGALTHDLFMTISFPQGEGPHVQPPTALLRY